MEATKGAAPADGRKLRGAVLFIACFLFWTVVVGMEWWLKMPAPTEWFADFQEAAAMEVQSRENQWIVYAFFTLYALTFLWLPLLRALPKIRSSEREFAHLRTRFPDQSLLTSAATVQEDATAPPSCEGGYGLPIVGALFLAILGIQYWRNYDSIAPESSALVLLTGLMGGLGFLFLARQSGEGARVRLTGAALGSLALFLALVALWQPEHSIEYHYRDRERWTGIWENPNRYGLLMGVGLLIALGRCASACLNGAVRPKHVSLACWGTIAAITGFGLLQSFSRGAWLGTALGAVYLIIRLRSAEHCSALASDQRPGRAMLGAPNSGGRLRGWASGLTTIARHLRLNRLPYGVILVSCFIILFWTCRHSEIPTLRRVFSAANPNDFSWRNRVAAYEGALQMMADRPIAGHGWGTLREQYGAFHARPRIAEPAAITLNDYLSLGAMLGVPALAGFLGLLALMLARRRDADDGPDSGIAIAASIPLLTGFWFDDGLFYLALGTPFWILLAISAVGRSAAVSKTSRSNVGGRSAAVSETSRSSSAANDAQGFTPRDPVAQSAAADPEDGTQPRSVPPWRPVLTCLAAFACLLFWIDSRDPFQRVFFSVSDSASGHAHGIAVLPKPVSPRPTIVYLHGSRGNFIKDGPMLRSYAELGLNTLSLDYNQTNSTAFDTGFANLLAWLDEQSWHKRGAVAWIGSSLGAQRSLSYLTRHPEQQPDLYVRVGGGLVDELPIPETDETTPAPVAPFSCPTLLVHGENDRIFPASDCRKLHALLQAGGAPVEMKVLKRQAHGFRPDRAVAMRAIGEYCAEALGLKPGAKERASQASALAWLPLIGLAGFAVTLGAKRLRRWRNLPDPHPTSASAPLRRLAAGFALSATVLTIVHWSLPAMSASSGTAGKLTARLSVSPKARADFEHLMATNLGADSRMRDLIDHAQLANYRDPFLYPDPGLDPETRKDCIVSPVIDASDRRPADWRRPLWESFYPRVRKESDPMKAAQIVARFLRERVGVASDIGEAPSLAAAWRQQTASARDWERLYVAALRSATIAARLNAAGRAEIWDGSEWKPAPRPAVDGRLMGEKSN